MKYCTEKTTGKFICMHETEEGINAYLAALGGQWDTNNILIEDIDQQEFNMRLNAGVPYNSHIADSVSYEVKRKREYPSIMELVVALAEKEEGNSVAWDELSAKRTEIKNKYPTE